jgi:SET domain-containing protein
VSDSEIGLIALNEILMGEELTVNYSEVLKLNKGSLDSDV